MSTQNIYQNRFTWTNLATGTYYAPYQVGGAIVQATFTATTANAWIDCDGFDHLSFMFKLVSGAANSQTLTIESDDSVTATYEWDETLGSYDSTTNTFNATYAAGALVTTRGHLHLDDCNGKRFHIKLVVVDGGAASNSGIMTIRATKV